MRGALIRAQLNVYTIGYAGPPRSKIKSGPQRALNEIRAIRLFGGNPLLSIRAVGGVLGNVCSCGSVSSGNINHLMRASIRKRNIALVVMRNDPTLRISHIRPVQLNICAIVFRAANNIQNERIVLARAYEILAIYQIGYVRHGLSVLLGAQALKARRCKCNRKLTGIAPGNRDQLTGGVYT